MKKSILISLLVLISLTSCMTPTLTKRYETNQTAVPEILVAVDAFSYTASPSEEKKNLLNLSDGGQQEFIKAVAAIDTKPEIQTLISDLALPLEAAQPSTFIDKTKYKRKLVFAIRNKSYRPADRIVKVDITLTLNVPKECSGKNEKPFIFSNMDKIANDYQTVDIGKLNFTNSTALGLTGAMKIPSASTAGVTGEIGASASQNKSLQEEVLLKQRYVASAGTLTEDAVTLMEESVMGIDLIGNLIAVVDLKAKNIAEAYIFKFKGLFNKTGSESDESKIEIQRIPVFYPGNKEDITAKLVYTLWVRKVKKGDATIQEADDEVEFIEKKGSEPSIKIISQDDLRLKTWQIRDQTHVLQMKFEEDIKTMNGSASDIEFDSFDDARAFLKWLKLTKRQIIKQNELWLNNKKITTTEAVLQSLNVARVVN